MADGIVETRGKNCSRKFGDINFREDARSPVDHKALREANKEEPCLEAKFNRCVDCGIETLKSEMGINPIKVANEVCYKAVVKPIDTNSADFNKIFNPDKSTFDDLFKPPTPDYGTDPDIIFKTPKLNFGTSF